jgi:hypothetical protein
VGWKRDEADEGGAAETSDGGGRSAFFHLTIPSFIQGCKYFCQSVIIEAPNYGTLMMIWLMMVVVMNIIHDPEKEKSHNFLSNLKKIGKRLTLPKIVNLRQKHKIINEALPLCIKAEKLFIHLENARETDQYLNNAVGVSLFAAIIFEASIGYIESVKILLKFLRADVPVIFWFSRVPLGAAFALRAQRKVRVLQVRTLDELLWQLSSLFKELDDGKQNYLLTSAIERGSAVRPRHWHGSSLATSSVGKDLLRLRYCICNTI